MLWARAGSSCVLPVRSPRPPETRPSDLQEGLTLRYTLGMKTAISIPDKTFKKADRLAKRLKKSRSQLYSEAVAEYVLRHDPDAITKQMNRVCAALGSDSDPFLPEAVNRILQRTEW